MKIDQYAYQSKLRNKDTFLKLYFSLTSIGVGLWSQEWRISVGLLVLMCYLTAAKGKIQLKVFVKLLLMPMSFLVIGVMGIAVSFGWQKEAFLHAIPLFEGYIGLTKAGLQQALALFFKALGATSSMYFLILNTPMVDLLSAFKKLKLPKLLIEMMALMYRFILIFMETADNIYVAQRSRIGYRNIQSSYHDLGALASALFVRSFKRSEDIYRALEARGYTGELTVLEEPKSIDKMNFVWVTLFEVALIVLTLYISSKGLG